MTLSIDGLLLPLADFTLDVTFESDAPVTGIFGPSGAGKTSLLEAIAGLRRPSAGRISIDGITLTDVARGIHVPPRFRRTGYVPQDNLLFPHMTVRGNLRVGDRAGQAIERIAAVLEISHLLQRSVRELSGGEQKRVALGRALCAGPSILLLDEPLSSLDERLRNRVSEYLRRVRDELRVRMLYVSHDRDELAGMAQQMIVLERGKARGASPAPDRLSAF
jgi:molybdate transport system ATP-binding protein